MEFFCYHRDRVGSTPLRSAMVEQHWSYMDGFAEAMIARGPTFTDDGTLTGSVHILDFPDPAAARALALDEPGSPAGPHRDVLLPRWHNPPGRTMRALPQGQPHRHPWLGLRLTPRPMTPAPLPR